MVSGGLPLTQKVVATKSMGPKYESSFKGSNTDFDSLNNHISGVFSVRSAFLMYSELLTIAIKSKNQLNYKTQQVAYRVSVMPGVEVTASNNQVIEVSEREESIKAFLANGISPHPLIPG